ncbi:Pr6Pr family membrane protein [Algoriphagus yeomjeoni]|uniref:Pr6Pr family membrane protein n=1 Tax=Algoriphagus yeomjeoni TaxID=291403 RepID=UPI003CE527D9
MKKKLALFFALLGWFAVITQFILMLENRVTPIPEAVIRFFSFFTILTNTLVALYFTRVTLAKNLEDSKINNAGILTAITVYIFMVGIVYQVALRHIWQPEGLQMLVDEILHSIIPVLVIVFWARYEKTRSVYYSQIFKWAIYPIAYLLYILVRGSFSNFYPYPFVDVTSLGMTTVLINSLVLLLLFTLISTLFVGLGKSLIRR